MKKILLTAAVLIGISGLNAQVIKDPGTYAPNTEEGVTFESEWIYSLQTENYTAATHPYLANVGGARTATLANGKLYVGERVEVKEGETLVGYEFYLNVMKGDDGTLLERKRLTDDLFKKEDGTYVAYPLNSTRSDANGALVFMNMTLNIQTSNFQVWVMPNEFMMPIKLLDYVNDFGASAAMRIDYANVYGDVFGDGYIIAVIGGSDATVATTILRWPITGGVVAEQPEMIFANEFSPAVDFNQAPVTTFGLAPCAFPVNDRTFYVDGNNTYPTKYDADGNIVDKFENAPEGTPFPVTGANGVLEFSIGSQKFLIAGLSVHAASAYEKNSFGIYKMGAGGKFAGMKHLYNFPSAGLGGASNASYVMLPFVDKIDDTSVYVYVYALANGIAKYKLTYGTIDGIEDQFGDGGLTIGYENGQFVFSSTVASAEVYSIAGAKVAEAKNVSEMTANAAQGVYIVKAATVEGNVVTKKVMVK